MATDGSAPAGSGTGRRTLAAYAALFVLMLVAAPAATLFHRSGDGLGGIENRAPLPRPTLSTWMDGSFQTGFEQWVDQNNGLRRFLVKTANQINYSVFSEVTYKTSSELILGKDRVLYQGSYIDSYNGLDLLPNEGLDAFARDLRRLQDRLSARGVAFLFLLTPSKASVEAQYIPDSLLWRQADSRTNYQKFLPFLERRGVHYLDGHVAVMSLKENQGFPVFPKGGTHWNYYASLRVTQALISRLESLLGKPLAHLVITNIRWDIKPFGTDGDLLKLANLWKPSPFYSMNPCPEVRAEAPPNAFRPNILFVGGSFTEHPAQWLRDHHVVADPTSFDFYYKDPIQDLEREVYRRDAVILETNESMIPRRGFGFVETVLAR